MDTTVDRIAQAVIDRIEERSELSAMVELVAKRVMELQRQEAELKSADDRNGQETSTQEDGNNE